MGNEKYCATNYLLIYIKSSRKHTIALADRFLCLYVISFFLFLLQSAECIVVGLTVTLSNYTGLN